jgi:hypothetical protein
LFHNLFQSLLLIQEKEQLLRELRSIERGEGLEHRNDSRGSCRSKGDMDRIRKQIKGLQRDLNSAMEMSSKAIADRYVYSRINEFVLFV